MERSTRNCVLHYRGRACFAFSLLSLLASTSHVLANPEGGVVSAGAADIVASGNRLDIQQKTERVVIDWRSFNISVSEVTEFHQPSTGAIAVNRVNDPNPSYILGALKANGNVVIMNPSGVLFGKDAQVDVGGLIATTLDLENNEVMAGGALKFTKVNGATGSVSNEGRITAREAGLVGLVSDQVENSGVITARMGKVVLASGDSATIDFQGDGLLSLEVSDDNAKRLIRHSGTIEADGGEVLLTAAAGRTIVDTLIEVKGEIKAPTVGRRNGKIIISANGLNRTTRTGNPSKVVVSGTVEARGEDENEEGGGVQILGDRIEIEETARILSDGTSGGGTINIGGSFQGGGDDPDYTLLSVRRPELEDLQAAQDVIVKKGAEIDASSTEDGNGGNIILWADRSMFFYGSNRARGGQNSGNGGFIETSGKYYLDYNGTSDTRAPNGEVGTLLLDPTNITISNVADQNISAYPTYSPTGDDVVSNLSVATLQSAMELNTVLVQTRATGSQAGDINVNDDISAYDWDNGYSLNLIADHDININASMQYSGDGELGFIAGHDLNVNDLVTATRSIVFEAQNNIEINGHVVTNTLYLRSGGDVHVADTIDASTTYLDTLISGSSVSLGNNSGTLNIDSSEMAHFSTKNFAVGIMGASIGDIMIEDGDGYDGIYAVSESSGSITTVGDLSFDGGNLTLSTNSLHIGGAITGNGGEFRVQTQSVGQSIGVGDGTGGVVHISSSDLSGISGWGTYAFSGAYSSTPITVASHTWDGGLSVFNVNSTINIAGDQIVPAGKDVVLSLNDTMGAININGSISGGEDITLTADQIQISGDLSGTGELTLSPYNGGVGIGTGAAGTLNLDDAELDHIQDGWSSVEVLSYGAATMNTRTWQDPLSVTTYLSGNLNVNGAQTMGANDLTLSSDGDIALNADLSGTGILTLSNTNSSHNATIASSGGAFNLGVAELNHIQDGWSKIVLNGATSSNTVDIAAYTWHDPVKFGGGAGTMTFSGVQNFGSNDVEISSNRLLDFNADLIGTGQLSLYNASTAGGTNIGSTASASLFRILGADIDTYLIGKGWSSFVIGTETNSGPVTFSGARNWNADLFVKAKGTLAVSAAADQNVGDHDLTILTDSNPNLSANLTGTGTFTIAPISYQNSAKSIGVGTGSGFINISSIELAKLTAGWDRLVFGREDQYGDIYIGANTYSDPVSFLTGGTVYLEGNLVSSDVSADVNKFVFVSPGFDNGSSYTIDPGTGRYLVYGWDGSFINYGGLARTTKRYNKTYASYGPGSVVETGNVFLYGTAPTIDITIDDKTREYGAADPAFSYSYVNGLIDGDVIGDAVTSATLSTTATATTNVGTAPITGSFLSDMGYQFNVVDGTISITKATLTATADDKTREYGAANPALTVSYSGFRNGEDASVLDTGATAATAANTLSNVGTYGITASGASDGNYDFSYAGGTLSITKATLTATADDKTREYGAANPALTVSYSGFRNGEDVSVLDTGATAATAANALSNVGTYGITASGASDGNYDFSYAGGALSVTQKGLLVSVPSQTITAGSAPNPYVVSYTGFVNGDDETILTQQALVRDNAGVYNIPGTYQITPYGAVGASNYNFTYVDSLLTILGNIPDSVSRITNSPPLIFAMAGSSFGSQDGVSLDGGLLFEIEQSRIQTLHETQSDDGDLTPVDHIIQAPKGETSFVSDVSLRIERSLRKLLGL